MEVPDGRFYALKVVHMVDAFGGRWCNFQNEVDIVPDVFSGGDLIEFVEGLPSILDVEDDSIYVLILNISN